MTLTTILLLWCVAALVLAPIVGRMLAEGHGPHPITVITPVRGLQRPPDGHAAQPMPPRRRVEP